MGGSDPFIVLGTDNLDETVQEAVAARIEQRGPVVQRRERMIVIDELYEQFLAKFMARAHRCGTGRSARNAGRNSGRCPLRSRPNASKIRSGVRSSRAATVVAGGKRNDNYFEPTVLTDITPEERHLP